MLLLLALLIIAAAVVAMIKRIDVRLVLLVAGLLMALAAGGAVAIALALR